MNSKRLIYAITMILLTLFIIISCASRDENVQSKTYTTKISVLVDADYALGNISYIDPITGITKIEFPDNINKEFKKEFNVEKGYKTNININLLGLDGNLKIIWTIIDNKGNYIQNFNKNVYRKQQSYKDQYTNTL
ncbi:hypothetical protein [Elizabethkingia anophelis]|uniref:hypothetical protein n=1 Tax=Elizabethkingia anophelis TaxID=1117645 RepID=UPI001629DE5E|nr:hypothetical protein [Elizabethkingia anophelis]